MQDLCDWSLADPPLFPDPALGRPEAVVTRGTDREHARAFLDHAIRQLRRPVSVCARGDRVYVQVLGLWVYRVLFDGEVRDWRWIAGPDGRPAIVAMPPRSTSRFELPGEAEVVEALRAEFEREACARSAPGFANTDCARRRARRRWRAMRVEIAPKVDVGRLSHELRDSIASAPFSPLRIGSIEVRAIVPGSTPEGIASPLRHRNGKLALLPRQIGKINCLMVDKGYQSDPRVMTLERREGKWRVGGLKGSSLGEPEPAVVAAALVTVSLLTHATRRDPLSATDGEIRAAA